MPATLDEEYFGSPSKIGLMRRSKVLWSLLCDDPRFSYYGRSLFIADERPDSAMLVACLARLTGASFASFYPKTSVERLFAELEDMGLSTDRHEHYRGGEDAYESANKAVRDIVIPSGIAVVKIGSDTDALLLSDLAALWEDCGVMPVPGSVMRGAFRRGIVLAALDENGKPVSAASSFVMHHPDSERANDVFWGMLATRDAWRGKKLGLLLGARAIVHMWEIEGARGFSTGVRAENRPSQALCEKLSVRDTDWVYASCIDTELLGGDSITK
jgi:hypothetical protein